jgi:hypothetical protein
VLGFASDRKNTSNNPTATGKVRTEPVKYKRETKGLLHRDDELITELRYVPLNTHCEWREKEGERGEKALTSANVE